MNPSSQSSIEQIATMVKEKLSLKPGFSVEEFRVITKTVGCHQRQIRTVPIQHSRWCLQAQITLQATLQPETDARRVLAIFLTLEIPGLKPSHRAGRSDGSEFQAQNSVRAV